MNGKNTKLYTEKLIADKGIPYLDICMSKGEKILFRHFASKDRKATGRERLFLFSCSKPLTVIGAMRLIEEGKLGLDDEVEKYLPAFANAFTLDERGNRLPVKTKMTVRHLFTMSGGLSYNTQTEEICKVKAQTDGKGTTEEFVNAFARTPLLFDPGERFEYSLCHDVLAAVAEKAAGKRFSQYMQEAVFSPLGMQDTGFHTESAGMADMYFCQPSGDIKQMEPQNGLVLGENYDSGGAGVIGTVDDYVKFAQALACDGVANNGYRLIGAETLKAVRTPQHTAMSVKNSFTCIQGEDYAYGLGMRTRKKETEWGLPVGEFGWDGAAGTYLMVDPERKISVVIGMHLMEWPHVFVGEHLQLVKCLYEDMRAEGLL